MKGKGNNIKLLVKGRGGENCTCMEEERVGNENLARR